MPISLLIVFPSPLRYCRSTRGHVHIDRFAPPRPYSSSNAIKPVEDHGSIEIHLTETAWSAKEGCRHVLIANVALRDYVDIVLSMECMQTNAVQSGFVHKSRAVFLVVATIRNRHCASTRWKCSESSDCGQFDSTAGFGRPGKTNFQPLRWSVTDHGLSPSWI